MTELLFKVLSEDGTAYHGGFGTWHLPNGKPGKWMRVEGSLRPCRNGLHVCRPQDLLAWLGPAIWRVEAGKERVVGADKVVVRRARLVERLPWDDRSARLFAADCAERVLPLFERAYPNDDRPRRAIEAGRAFANGEIGAAARAVAGDAARAVAWDAAGDAARAAAGAAARAAAGDAARAVAWDAAWDAARAAARAAAGDAAWAAAWAAEYQWQTMRLMHYLEVDNECSMFIEAAE